MQNNLLFLGNWRRTCTAAAGAAILILLASGPTAFGQAAAIHQTDPTEPFYKLGFKFQPAATCATANCHSKAPPNNDADGRVIIGHELVLWQAPATPTAPADPHNSAFKKLNSPEAKGYATKLGIATPASDAACISCHTIKPPTELAAPSKPGDPTLKLNESVTCNACHGPSGSAAAAGGWVGWGTFHTGKTAEEWKQKKATIPHADMVKQFGYYNTHPLLERSQRCMSCHLSIDSAILAAGHPQPMFEMNWLSLTYPNRHWNDPHDPKDPNATFFEVRLWSSGQIVALRDSLHQLADRAKNGAPAPALNAAYSAAYAHLTVLTPLFDAKVGGLKGNLSPVSGQFGAIFKALKDPKALEAAATAASDAAEKLNPEVAAYTPSADPTLALAKVIAKTPMTGLGAYGIEQQRDAVFALYDALANNPGAAKAVTDNRDLIGQKLFPTDAGGAVLTAEKIKAADYTKALDEVKKALGV